MSIKISTAPCCWGVDDPKNPYLPQWTLVLNEAHQAGYKGIELGPYGYLPIDIELVSQELQKNDLFIVAGTIFDDLVAEENQEKLQQQAHDICRLITQLPQAQQEDGQKFPTPYLVLIDWGHDERDYAAGHPDIRIFNKLFKNFGEFIQFCPSSKSFKNSIILSKAFW